MTEQDKQMMVEWVNMKTGYSKDYLKKMPLKELEVYYFDCLEEGML